ncbi:hypothetical protein V3C99_009527 [Haemonchus contortus]
MTGEYDSFIISSGIRLLANTRFPLLLVHSQVLITLNYGTAIRLFSTCSRFFGHLCDEDGDENYMLLFILMASTPIRIGADEGYPLYLENEYYACSPWIYIHKFKKCYIKFCIDRWYNEQKELCSKLGGSMVDICSPEENFYVSMLSRFHNKARDPATDRYTFIALRKKPGFARVWYWNNGANCTYFNWSYKNNDPDFPLWEHATALYTPEYNAFDEWASVSELWTGKVICQITDCNIDKIGLGSEYSTLTSDD